MTPKRPRADRPRHPTLFDLEDIPEAAVTKPAPAVERTGSADGTLVGTSSFTARGWPGSFYPAGLKPGEYLSFYATQFDTVEVDSTFYGPPALAAVQAWYAKTPANFVFALKIPQVITHEKVLVGAEDDLTQFLKTVEALGEKLGPLLFQFGYFNASKFPSQAEFLALVAPFLRKLPRDFRFALEIRNKAWLDARLADLLREHGVALAFIDQGWMPRPWEIGGDLDLVTADFCYVRLLGDRKGIEEETTTWNRTIVDRTPEITSWTRYLRPILSRGKRIYVYCNNHYAGCGYETVRLFQKVFGK